MTSFVVPTTDLRDKGLWWVPIVLSLIQRDYTHLPFSNASARERARCACAKHLSGCYKTLTTIMMSIFCVHGRNHQSSTGYYLSRNLTP